MVISFVVSLSLSLSLQENTHFQFSAKFPPHHLQTRFSREKRRRAAFRSPWKQGGKKIKKKFCAGRASQQHQIFLPSLTRVKNIFTRFQARFLSWLFHSSLRALINEPWFEYITVTLFSWRSSRLLIKGIAHNTHGCLCFDLARRREMNIKSLSHEIYLAVKIST